MLCRDSCELSCELITAHDLTYLLGFKVEVNEKKLGAFDMVDVLMYVTRHTYRNETIVECTIETANYYDHILCIFYCDYASTLLKSCAIGAFCLTGRHTLMHLEHVRVHWLNCAACLVTEVKSAFVLPLRSAFDTAREAESFPIGINNLEATETSVGHKLIIKEPIYKSLINIIIKRHKRKRQPSPNGITL